MSTNQRLLELLLAGSAAAWAQPRPFQVEEASIRDIQSAIRIGRATCRECAAYVSGRKPITAPAPR